MKGLALGVLLMILTAPAFAATVQVTLTADKTMASPEDTVVLHASVEGDGSQPVLTNADAFEVQLGGTSSQIQIVNGRMSSSKSYTFVLTPKKQGLFTVGPVQVVSNGQTYNSGTVTISVSDAPSQDAFLEVEVSNKTPYVGEQVLYTIRFYTLALVQNVELKPMEFEGFFKESLGDSKSYQRVIEGRSWQVSEVQWALYPMNPGSVSIPAPRVVAQFLVSSRSRSRSLFDDPFFDMDRFFRQPQQRTLSGETAALEVKPLPTEGKPADFSGLVGTFQIALEYKDQVRPPQADVEGEAPAALPTEGATRAPMIESGQSTTVTVTVKGDGDLRSLSDLRWSLPEGVKVYDDQPALAKTPTANGLVQAKTFRKAIVPLKEGDLTLPPISLSYFDPKLGEYRTLETSEIGLKVRPSSQPDALRAMTPETQAVSPVEGRVRSFLSNPILRKTVLGIFLAALAFLIVRKLLRKRRLFLEKDPGYKKRKRALKSALRSLRMLSAKSDRFFYEDASLLLRDFLGDKFGIDGRALTPADIKRRLAASGVSEENLDRIIALLRDCEEGLYGGQEITPSKRSELTERLKEILGRF